MNAIITPPEPGSSRQFRVSHNTLSLLIRLIAAVGLTVGLAAGSIRNVFALTITVNTTADESGAGASCSLREAIYSANTDTAYGGCATGSGADTIVLAAGATYDLGAAPAISSTAFGPSAFAITSTITVSGSGATLTRSGTASARFFYVSAAGNLTLSNLTVSNGRHVGGNGGNGAGGGGGAAGMGGAIFNEGSVTLDRSTFTGNAAIGGNGGNGSTSTTGTGGAGGGGMGGNGASVANGTCAAPTTGGNGGGPNPGTGGAAPTAGANGGGGGGGSSDSNGSTCQNSSAISGATGGFGGGGGGGGSDSGGGNSGAGGAGGFGGGGSGSGANAAGGGGGSAGAFGAGGTLGGDGGSNGGGGGGGAGLGGVVFNHAGTLTVRNSTFSANATTAGNAGSGGSADPGLARGGAIFSRNGTANINNTTFSANVTGDGAIYNLSESTAANLTVTNSILANTIGGDDCYSIGTSDTVTQANNVMESDTSCGTPTSTSDPQLVALATNGGSTQTHAIPTTSPAYNAGSNATCEATDQRGISRPQGTNCEIGAYEVVLNITGLAAQNSSPTRLTNTTFFTASVTGGTGVTYAWNFGDGSAVVSGANVNRIYTAAGAYTAIVTATNFNGSVSTTTPVTITNSAPVANAGADQTVSVNATVNLNGTGSNDPDNHTPLTYGWVQTGGAAVTLSDATAASPSFTAPGAPASLTFQLTVTDAQGLADPTPDTVVITINEAAITGLAAQNSSPTRLTDTTFFTASVTGGTGVTYQWNFGDGSPVVGGANVNRAYTAAGNYTAIVTATNGAGSVSTTAPVVITNDAPVADAGADQSVNVNATVNLNGAGSNDPDNHTPLTYGWVQTGGPAVTLSSATAASPSFTAPGAPGTLTFQLVVTDAQGLADATPDTVVITVNDIAISGLNATSSSPTRLTDATFFTATTSAGTNVVYTWNFGDGSPTVTGATVNYVYGATGSYTAIVTATNGQGSTSENTAINVTNVAPAADAGPDQTVNSGATVTLNGTGSNDPDGHTPLSYGWTQTSGPAVTLSSATAASPSFTAPGAPGTLTFQLVVTDSTGLADASPDEVTITVGDAAITGLSASSSSPTRLTDATFFTATITGGSNAAYTWNFGDGSPTVTGANVNYTYAAAGSYTAIVTATNSGGSSSATTTVVVINQAPVANAGVDQSVTAGTTVNLNGSASTDPDGHTPLSYGWVQIGGPIVALSNASAAAPSFTAPGAPGVLTFTLTVTDAQGLADASPDEVVVTITDIPIAGLSAANSSPTRLTSPSLFTATIGAGTSAVYTWDFGDGSPTATGATAARTYAAVGTYTAIVTATNGVGTVSATTQVTITNDPPMANAGADQTVDVNTTATLNGAASADPDNHLPLTYAWQQTGGPAMQLSSNAASAPTFTAPAAPTVLTFTLAVTDSTGLTDATPDEVVVRVQDAAIGGLSAASSSPTRLTDTTFFTATILAGSNVSYEWGFGDGSPTRAGQTVTHTYAMAGNYTAIVTATNSRGAVNATTLVVVVNQAPVADAGADQNVSIGGSVSLIGSASADPDNHLPLSYAWQQVSGPAVTLNNANTVSPSFIAPAAPAVLTFSLVVTDAQGAADATPDQVVINVIDIGVSGLSAQNSSPTRLTDATAFTVTITSGSGVTYSWDFGDGTPAAMGATALHVYAAPGTYVAVVTAQNGIGSVTASTLVVVTNQAPVANAGADQSVVVGASVTLNGDASSDPDNHVPLSYAWQQTGGPAVTLSNPASSAPAFTAPAAPSVLTFTLAVTDAQGAADGTPDEVIVTVSDAPVTGLAASNNGPTIVGQTTQLAAATTGGTNVSYAWDFGDGSPVAAGATVNHSYAAVGSYTAIVTATNSAGSASATTVVVVKDVPITGLAIETSAPSGIVGAPVIFTAVHATGTGLSYAWDFGDGTVGTANANASDGAVISHVYAAAGSYTVKVTATNTSGTVTAQKVFAVVAIQRKVFVPLAMRQ